jgi:hypothetical protein
MDAERKTFDVHGFDAVELRWVGDLNVTQGQGESLAVEGDPELIQKLTVRVDGGALLLEVGQDWLDRLVEGLRMLGRKALTYHVGVETLRRLAVSGSGTVRCERLRTDELTLALSGRANVRIDDLEARALRTKIAGRGEIELRGHVEEARLDIAGSGEVEMPGLALKRAEVHISGHGESELTVSDELDVSISGYGRVRYHGDPHVRQSIAGAGSVTRLGD